MEAELAAVVDELTGAKSTATGSVGTVRWILHQLCEHSEVDPTPRKLGRPLSISFDVIEERDGWRGLIAKL